MNKVFTIFQVIHRIEPQNQAQTFTRVVTVDIGCGELEIGLGMIEIEERALAGHRQGEKQVLRVTIAAIGESHEQHAVEQLASGARHACMDLQRGAYVETSYLDVEANYEPGIGVVDESQRIAVVQARETAVAVASTVNDARAAGLASGEEVERVLTTFPNVPAVEVIRALKRAGFNGASGR